MLYIKKLLLYCFALLSLVFLSGCSNKHHEEGYIYNIEAIAGFSDGTAIIDKQKLYLGGDKWKIEHNSIDKQPLNEGIDLFDGEYQYVIVKVVGNYFGEKNKENASQKQKIYISNPAYALINWDVPNRNNFYTNFKTTVRPKNLAIQNPNMVSLVHNTNIIGSNVITVYVIKIQEKSALIKTTWRFQYNLNKPTIYIIIPNPVLV